MMPAGQTMFRDVLDRLDHDVAQGVGDPAVIGQPTLDLLVGITCHSRPSCSRSIHSAPPRMRQSCSRFDVVVSDTLPAWRFFDTLFACANAGGDERVRAASRR